MKIGELRELHTSCVLCKRQILDMRLPLFWRVRIERFGINLMAIKQPNDKDHDAAERIGGQVMLTLCEPCAMMTPLVYRALELG